MTTVAPSCSRPENSPFPHHYDPSSVPTADKPLPACSKGSSCFLKGSSRQAALSAFPSAPQTPPPGRDSNHPELPRQAQDAEPTCSARGKADAQSEHNISEISWPPEPVTALREGLDPRHATSTGVTHPWITGSFLEAQCPGIFEVNPKFQVDWGGIAACGPSTGSCGSRPGNCTPFPGNFQSQSGWEAAPGPPCRIFQQGLLPSGPAEPLG